MAGGITPESASEDVQRFCHVTPRRAAMTEKGRQKLVAWLKYLENGAARHETCSPMAEYERAPGF
jgi:hypothetical protein